jgi:hypothetical protein
VTAAEENLRLLERMDADRQFLLLAMQSNPALLARAEEPVRERLLAAIPSAGFLSA